jgi:hypothetical protein
MPAPSQLAIATSVLNRLIKEEKSYHKELEQQNVKIAKLEAGEDADNENAEFIIRQQVSDVTDRCNLSTYCVGLYRHVLTDMSRSKQLSRPRQSFLA